MTTTTRRDPLPEALAALTVLSGVVDAVSYLGLGHVFTANMTGNIVVLGFAAAGAQGFSVAASLTSLLAFLAGAAAAGRANRRIASRRTRFIAAVCTEAVGLGAAAVVSASAGTAGDGRYVVIALMAIAMGVRNATVRSLAVPDMTTTVLTLTLTGLAADSALAGGDNPRAVRRSGAVAAMLVGAFVGAVIVLHTGLTRPLLAVCLCVAGTATWYALRPSPSAPPTPSNAAAPTEPAAAKTAAAPVTATAAPAPAPAPPVTASADAVPPAAELPAAPDVPAVPHVPSAPESPTEPGASESS